MQHNNSKNQLTFAERREKKEYFHLKADDDNDDTLYSNTKISSV